MNLFFRILLGKIIVLCAWARDLIVSIQDMPENAYVILKPN
jgi:hypothetical protein